VISDTVSGIAIDKTAESFCLSHSTTKQINKANGFHSFIKERLDAARGVATIYLNRYNALFSKAYGSADKSVVDDIFKLMTTQAGRFFSVFTHSERQFAGYIKSILFATITYLFR
jgi:hypothetical protein